MTGRPRLASREEDCPFGTPIQAHGDFLLCPVADWESQGRYGGLWVCRSLIQKASGVENPGLICLD